MKRPLRPEERRLWAEVATTLRLAPGKTIPNASREIDQRKNTPLIPAKAGTQLSHQPRPVLLGPRLRGDERKIEADRNGSSSLIPHPIEPARHRRIARERDGIEARLDLHGLDQDRARTVLHAFLRRAHDQGFRAVLVITGKGTLGDGVLRRRAPDWLAEPAVRPLIAGVSPAARHHGGEGALYVALKRRP